MKKVQSFAAALVAVALTACNAPAEEADAATDAETTEVEAPVTDEADAGAEGEADAAAEGEADAGAEGEADAGEEGEADAVEGDI
jgi:hypothetical protein